MNPGPAPSRMLSRALFIGIGVLLAVLGAWLVVDPWLPPYGGKAGVIFHLAHIAVGIYGPAVVFALVGFALIFWSIRQRTG